MVKAKWWYLIIGAYLILHIGVMTKYSDLPEVMSEALLWVFALQWFIPTFMLILLVPRIQRWLNPVAMASPWTFLILSVVVGCTALYFTGAAERWFAWPTLGLLILLMLAVANTQVRPRSTSAWLSGAMIVLFAMGCWEALYQTGLLFYYDFFGSGIMSYWVAIGKQLLWVIPALIVFVVLYQRGLRPEVNLVALTCIGLSIVCTIVWFVGGMDIPLLFWKGYFVSINHDANPLLISISRGSQSFWLLGVASLYIRRAHAQVEVTEVAK